jgi:hypothetical protein
MCHLSLWAWWCTPVILALGRLKQGDHEIKASLDSIVSSMPVWAFKKVR